MTEDQFFDHYKPIKNHLNADAPEDGCMFETYGPELDFVVSQDANKIWTLVEGDNGNTFYMAGYHLVNRLGYFITEVPWETGEEEIECEGVPDEDFEAQVDAKLAEVRAQYGETIGPEEAYRIARNMVNTGD